MPDNHTRLSSYFNFVFNLVAESMSTKGLLSSWVHWKFIGDGAIYIWSLEQEESQDLGDRIFLAFHDLYRTYPTVIVDEAEDLKLREAPSRIRVGIAQGEISELTVTDGTECVGFSINLASRLQSYCRSIGFLISSSVSLTDRIKEEYPLVRARTKSRRGLQALREDVRYVPEDALHMSRRDLSRWFETDPVEQNVAKRRNRTKTPQRHAKHGPGNSSKQGGLSMDPITIIGTISAGLNLIDKFRSLALKVMGKSAGTPSVHAEAKGGVMEIKRQGHLVEHVDQSKLNMSAWDQSRYKTLEKKVKVNWQIFNDIDGELPAASTDEKARLRQRLESIKSDLCADFREMLEIYEQTLGTTLADHYSLYSVCGASDDGR